jgi:hypothetical protein
MPDRARRRRYLVMTRSERRDLPLEPAARGCPRPALRSSACRVRRVTGGAWSSVHSGATEPAAPGGAGSGSWRRKPCARNGVARDASRVAHPGPGSRYQGSPGPARRARARRGRGPPATCVVSRWQARVERGELRRPISCPVRPGYTRAYGITGPGGVICGAGGCVRVRGENLLPDCARAGKVWGVRGRAPGCGGAPAPSPENATAARGAGREGLRRARLEGPVRSGGTWG